MPYVPFHETFPDVAQHETREITVQSDVPFNLPPDTYTFLELFCDECDCRRVMFYVTSSKTQSVEAVIAYGWEARDFYVEWLGDDDDMMVDALRGPTLNLGSPQSQHASAILEMFHKVLLTDPAYIGRVKRHYAMFRRKIEGNGSPRPIDASSSLADRLERFGDARVMNNWPKGDPDYVESLGVTARDVPDLISVSRYWAERTDWPDDPDDLTVYAPIHAWRALAQLEAHEAIDALIQMLDPMDVRGDDWFLEEFPNVFAMIGPVTIAPLATFLADENHGLYARVCTAHALEQIAQRHPDARADVIGALTGQLEDFASTSTSLNGFIISYLLRLKATEAANIIERAYAADCIDISIVGNWNGARQELGVEGQGLVSSELANARATFVPAFRPASSADSINSGRRRSGADDKSRRRAAKKRERRNRRRGHRR